MREPAPTRQRLQQLAKWAALLILASMLTLIGNFESYIKERSIFFLNEVWKTSTTHHLHNVLLKNSGSAISLGYRLLYSSLCVLIVHVLFNKLSLTTSALWLYLALIFFTVLLYGVADLLNIPPLRTVAFRVDSLVVSPMPTVILGLAWQFLISGKLKA